jgi:hypothetical protein
MIGIADVDEVAELGSNRALKRCEHGVCVFIVNRDTVKCVVGDRIAFLVWYDVCPVSCMLEVYGGDNKVFAVMMNVCEEGVCGVHAEFR